MNERDHIYSIGELAELAGVTRRTVRYYVQRKLLPAPLGRGRGGHYDGDHLQRLLRIRTLQEQGRSLDEIHADLEGGDVPDAAPAAPAPAPVAMDGDHWIRIRLADGVELHLRARPSLPGPRAIRELQRTVLRILGNDPRREGR